MSNNFPNGFVNHVPPFTKDSVEDGEYFLVGRADGSSNAVLAEHMRTYVRDGLAVPVVQIVDTASATIADDTTSVLITYASGTVTLTMRAALAERITGITRVPGVAHDVTLVAAGSDTIDGAIGGDLFGPDIAAITIPLYARLVCAEDGAWVTSYEGIAALASVRSSAAYGAAVSATSTANAAADDAATAASAASDAADAAAAVDARVDAVNAYLRAPSTGSAYHAETGSSYGWAPASGVRRVSVQHAAATFSLVLDSDFWSPGEEGEFTIDNDGSFGVQLLLPQGGTINGAAAPSVFPGTTSRGARGRIVYFGSDTWGCAIAPPGSAVAAEKASASIRASGSQTIASNAAPSTTIAFDGSDFTPRGGDGAPEVDLVAHTITIKRAGRYAIAARCAWLPVAGAGPLGLVTFKNALDAAGLLDADVKPNTTASVPLMLRTYIEVDLDVDDVIYANALNTTGVDQSTLIGSAPNNAHIVPVLQVREL